MQFVFSAAAIMLLAAAQHVAAVCRPGELAAGTSYHSMLQGTNDVEYYSGFIMDTNCKILSQNGETQDYTQMCRGGYYHNAEVICDSSHNPTEVIDVEGNPYVCYGGADQSCDEHSPVEAFDVMSCCYRV